MQLQAVLRSLLSCILLEILLRWWGKIVANDRTGFLTGFVQQFKNMVDE